MELRALDHDDGLMVFSGSPSESMPQFFVVGAVSSRSIGAVSRNCCHRSRSGRAVLADLWYNQLEMTKAHTLMLVPVKMKSTSMPVMTCALVCLLGLHGAEARMMTHEIV